MKPASKQRALIAVAWLGSVALLIVGRGAAPVFFISIVVVTLASYAGTVASLTKHRHVSGRALMLAIGALMIIAVAVPPRASRDVWEYAMYGRMVAQHHSNPYLHTPAEFPQDPILARAQFPTLSSPYGPLFTGVSAAGMWSCDSSPLCARLFFQIIAALAILGATWLVRRSTGSWAAAACVGLNPVLVVSAVNGAHVDALVALALLAAVLAMRKQPIVTGLLLGAAALLKINALLPAAALLLWMLVRDRKAHAARAGAVCAAVVATGYWMAGGVRTLAPLRGTALLLSHHSIWAMPARWIAKDLAEDGWDRARAAIFAVHLVATLGFAVVLASATVLLWGRLRHHGPEPVVIAAIGAYLMTTPYVLPWYAAPLIVLVATRWTSKTTWLLLGFSAALFTVYPWRVPVHRTFATLLLPRAAFDVMPVLSLVTLIALGIAAWRRPRPRTQLTT